MKRTIGTLAFVALLALTMATTCAPRTTYNTLATVKASTDKTVSSYFLLVAQGKAPTNGVPNVSFAYNNFEVIFDASVLIASGNTNAPATTVVINAASNVAWNVTQAQLRK